MNLFKFAKKESSDQKLSYMIVIKNIERIVEDKDNEKAREWLFSQLD